MYLSKKLFPLLKEKGALKEVPSPIPLHRITCMADHHVIVLPKLKRTSYVLFITY